MPRPVIWLGYGVLVFITIFLSVEGWLYLRGKRDEKDDA